MNQRLLHRIDRVLESTYFDASGKMFWGTQGAGVLPIAESTGRILVALRSPHVNEPNTYGVWGGAIDPGEDPKRAAMRELQEEAGYRGKVKLVPAHVYTSPGGDFKYFNFLGVIEEEFKPRMDWETQDYEWVTFDELLDIRPKHFGLEELVDEDSGLISRYASSSRDSIED